jgi:hypothetical protein
MAMEYASSPVEQAVTQTRTGVAGVLFVSIPGRIFFMRNSKASGSLKKLVTPIRSSLKSTYFRWVF